MKFFFFNNKNISQTILKNSFWVMISEIVNRGVLFIMLAIVARYYGVEAFGKLSFSLSVVLVISMFSDFGLTTLFIKDAARDKQKIGEYFYNILFIKLLLNFFVIILFSLIIFLGKDIFSFDLIIMIYIFICYSAVLTFYNFFKSLFRIQEKMEKDAILQITNGILLFISVGIIILYNLNIILIPFGYLVSILTSFIICLIMVVMNKVKIKKEISLSIMKKVFKKSLPFFFSTLFVFIYYYMDEILLFLLKGEEATGLYSAAYKILLVFIAPIGLYLNVLLPTFSKNFKSGKIDKELKSFIKSNYKIFFIFSLFASLLVFLGADFITTLIYGKEYKESAMVLRILIISWFILVNYSIPVISLQAFDKQKIYMIFTFWGCIFNLILNLILIPTYSFYGAAIATVLTELFVGVILLIYFYKMFWNKYV